ncbi:uncharacterized protein LOC129611398 [Condylostylus longicornis]|uniref:uncharacterized protein LOC129611398 n=1 Tax=Condylostylus longicornis TaxID=2530218 RepID=UPI00244DC787|nr:uncharacterized protein LOC129611398 [Condylostylus longicornis]
MGKARIIWNRSMEGFVLDMWDNNIKDLQKHKKNGHIYGDMAASVNSQFGITDVTQKDIQVKIHNLTQRYRQERKLIASGAGSNWPLYERINKLLMKGCKKFKSKFGSNDSGSISEAKSSYEEEDSRIGEYDHQISIEDVKLMPRTIQETDISLQLTPRSYQKTHSTPEMSDQPNNFPRIIENSNQEKPFDQFGKYVAAELRQLPQRQAILLQQELQNCIIRTKLSCLECVQTNFSNYENHNNINNTTISTSSNSYDMPHMSYNNKINQNCYNSQR